MSETTFGPLNVVSINPSNRDHINELTRQRIQCGWSAEQVPEWMEEIRKGVRNHWLYYEASSGLPVGSAASTTLSHEGAMHVGDALPPSILGLCSLYIDPSFRGKSYANIIMDHRHTLAFSDSKIEKCVLDTLTRFQTLQTWHRRLGYVEVCEPKRSYKTVEELPDHFRRISEDLDSWKVSYFELTRERWEEAKMRQKLQQQTGIPLQLPDNRGYSDSVAQAFISESTSQK